MRLTKTKKCGMRKCESKPSVKRFGLQRNCSYNYLTVCAVEGTEQSFYHARIFAVMNYILDKIT